ncbi:hypothetical protein FVE85_2326 [Porphyridium purpureum]|uniref:Uncharacterized protein n=1 Tax=Porphyridium purpureum TaxID=35688 RepID=A0A5J4YX66_PORPP|nr:hypothetical protein FVE85_2326 [Porphyridium purpureum]|eukprot:POR3180..scf209_3
MADSAVKAEEPRRNSDVGSGTLQATMTFKKRFDDDPRGNLLKEVEERLPFSLTRQSADSLAEEESGYVSDSYGSRFERNQQNSFTDLRESNSAKQKERLSESQRLAELKTSVRSEARASRRKLALDKKKSSGSSANKLRFSLRAALS